MYRQTVQLSADEPKYAVSRADHPQRAEHSRQKHLVYHETTRLSARREASDLTKRIYGHKMEKLSGFSASSPNFPGPFADGPGFILFGILFLSRCAHFITVGFRLLPTG